MIRHLRSLLAVAALVVAAVAAPTAGRATTIERVVSPGGIEAWLVREPSIPLIAMDYSFKGGTSQDSKIKPGIGYMVSTLLDDGAGDLDTKAFHQRLEETAVEMRFSASRDYFSGSVKMLKDRQQDGFDLLRLALTQPRFDPDAVDRVRAQIISSLRRASTSPNDIATKMWWKTAFPGHPYGEPPQGSLDTVPLITPDDLKTYAHRVLARDTLKVSVVGDIDAATLGPLLDRVFGPLPAKSDLQPVAPAVVQGLGRRIVVDLDVPQSVISIGGAGIARADEDFIPAFIVNHILGGGSFSSRLYGEVREKRGLAYGVNSSLLSLDDTALFTVSTQVRSDKAAEALGIIESEVRRMAESGPTEEELAKAKSFLKGSYALAFDTSTKIAGLLLRIQIDKLGIDYIDKRNGLIDAVTLADTQRAAKRLAAGGMLVTVVGRPTGLASKEPGQ
jgi:zinc protease